MNGTAHLLTPVDYIHDYGNEWVQAAVVAYLLSEGQKPPEALLAPIKSFYERAEDLDYYDSAICALIPSTFITRCDRLVIYMIESYFHKTLNHTKWRDLLDAYEDL